MAHNVLLLFLSSFILSFNFLEAQMVPAVFVFGDSLVDVGNNNHLKLSLAKADFPHNGVDFPTKKPTGRFTNGKNAADFLAEKVGLPTSPPYLSLASNNGSFLTGVSFASGGAGIFVGTDERYSLPLTKQVDYYSTVIEKLNQQLGSSGAQKLLSKSLIAVVIGSNDIFGYFDSSDLRKKNTPQQYVDLMATTLKVQLQRIYNGGARKFVITGIGPIGCCPSLRYKNKTDECSEETNYWSAKYNEGLKSMLQKLKSEFKDINYSYFDTYSVLLSLIQNPTAYGFAEVKAACCGLGNLNARVACLPIAKYCSNRRDHVFWDLYHPTEAAHRILLDDIFYGSSQYTFPMNVKQLIAV
ncbi:GDSL esterase/lipase At5g55050-like isoform X2 [Quercus lobata]|uniref:GDSL esterase/lipase At5g55050-like isoform X2 n=1 Tax=Quercus lobata TaxID=97700 RepID=UPI0012492560|nr:GDSL esterase/lipase At5g55050-like isoform X2 [Quercus lobata]